MDTLKASTRKVKRYCKAQSQAVGAVSRSGRIVCFWIAGMFVRDRS